MPIDSLFIQHLAVELNDAIKEAKVKKVYNINNNEILFKLSNKKNLLFTNKAPFLKTSSFDTPQTPSNLVMQIRKHLENYTIMKVEAVKTERIIKLTLEGLNELKDRNTKYIYYEILGRISNFIVTDAEHKIIIVTHRLINEFRTIIPNAIYELPVHDRPYFLDTINYEHCYGTNQKILTYIKNNSLDFIDDVTPTLMKDDLYFTNIFPGKTFSTLSELLESFSQQKLTKHQDYNLVQIVAKQLKKEDRRLEKLHSDLKKNKQNFKYRDYGDLILTYGYRSSDNQILKCSTFDNEEIEIPLVEDLSISENANHYFKLYRKAKNSIPHLEEQIELTNQRINYLKNIEMQLQFANSDQLKPIYNELVSLKVIKGKKLNENKKTYTKKVIDNTTIIIGKNNKQNEEITFKNNRNFYWLHTKDTPGSHVVVQSENPSKKVLQVAAELAAYYSKDQKETTSRVIVTQIKYLKKDKFKLGGVIVKQENIVNVKPTNHLEL